MTDVVLDRAGEEQGILKNDADLLSQRCQLDLADVGLVQEHSAALRVTEPRDQADEGGFAGARRSDDPYDLAGQAVASTDPLGATSLSGYNPRGWLTRSTDALGNVATTLFDRTGNVTGALDALGRLATTLFDTAGRATVSIDPLGRRTTTTYDPAGNVSTVTQPSGSVTSYAYDALNRQTMTTEAVGTSAHAALDRLSTAVGARQSALLVTTTTGRQALALGNGELLSSIDRVSANRLMVRS